MSLFEVFVVTVLIFIAVKAYEAAGNAREAHLHTHEIANLCSERPVFDAQGERIVYMQPKDLGLAHPTGAEE